jgi:hypothetical protein
VWGDQTFVRVTAADPVLARTAYRASFAAGTNPGNWLRASVRSSVQGSAGALTASVRIYAWNWATQKLRLLGAGTTSNATNTTQFQVPLGSLRSPTGAVEIVVQHVSQSPGSTMDTDFDAITVEILP